MVILKGKLVFTGSLTIGAFGNGGGAGPGAHQYWRISVSESTGSDLYINEMQFRPYMGEDWAPYADGTGSASSFWEGSPSEYAFDNDINTGWYVGESEWNFESGLPIGTPPWIGYTFSSPIEVVQVAIQSNTGAGGSASPGPATYDVQWSDDGDTWTTAWSVTKTQTYSINDGSYPSDQWIVADYFGGINGEPLEGGGPSWEYNEINGGGDGPFWAIEGSVNVTRDTLLVDDLGVEPGNFYFNKPDGGSESIFVWSDSTVGDIIDYLNERYPAYRADIHNGHFRLAGIDVPEQYNTGMTKIMGAVATQTRYHMYIWTTVRSTQTVTASTPVMSGLTLTYQSATLNTTGSTTIQNVLDFISSNGAPCIAYIDPQSRLVIANKFGDARTLQANGRFPVEIMCGGSVDAYGQYLDAFGNPLGADVFETQKWVMFTEPTLGENPTSANAFIMPSIRPVIIYDGTESLTLATTIKSIFPNYTSVGGGLGVSVMIMAPSRFHMNDQHFFPWVAISDGYHDNWTVGDGLANIRQGSDYGEFAGNFYADLIGGNIRIASLRGVGIAVLESRNPDNPNQLYPAVHMMGSGWTNPQAAFMQVSKRNVEASDPLINYETSPGPATYYIGNTLLGTRGVSGFNTVAQLLSAINAVPGYTATISNNKLVIGNTTLDTTKAGLKTKYPSLSTYDAYDMFIGASYDSGSPSGWSKDGQPVPDLTIVDAARWRGFYN